MTVLEQVSEWIEDHLLEIMAVVLVTVTAVLIISVMGLPDHWVQQY